MNQVIDRNVQYPRRYTLTQVGSGVVLGTFDFSPVTGEVISEGTPINAELFNSIANSLEVSGTTLKLKDKSGNDLSVVVTHTIEQSQSDSTTNLPSSKLLKDSSYSRCIRDINQLSGIGYDSTMADIVTAMGDSALLVSYIDLINYTNLQTGLVAGYPTQGTLTIQTDHYGNAVTYFYGKEDYIQVLNPNPAYCVYGGYLRFNNDKHWGGWKQQVDFNNTFARVYREATDITGITYPIAIGVLCKELYTRNLIDTYMAIDCSHATENKVTGLPVIGETSQTYGQLIIRVPGTSIRMDIEYTKHMGNGNADIKWIGDLNRGTTPWTVNWKQIIDDSSSQKISGVKEFTTSPIVPTTPSGPSSAVAKSYADRVGFARVYRSFADLGIPNSSTIAEIHGAMIDRSKAILSVSTYVHTSYGNTGLELPNGYFYVLEAIRNDNERLILKLVGKASNSSALYYYEGMYWNYGDTNKFTGWKKIKTGSLVNLGGASVPNEKYIRFASVSLASSYLYTSGVFLVYDNDRVNYERHTCVLTLSCLTGSTTAPNSVRIDGVNIDQSILSDFYVSFNPTYGGTTNTFDFYFKQTAQFSSIVVEFLSSSTRNNTTQLNPLQNYFDLELEYDSNGNLVTHDTIPSNGEVATFLSKMSTVPVYFPVSPIIDGYPTNDLHAVNKEHLDGEMDNLRTTINDLFARLVVAEASSQKIFFIKSSSASSITATQDGSSVSTGFTGVSSKVIVITLTKPANTSTYAYYFSGWTKDGVAITSGGSDGFIINDNGNTSTLTFTYENGKGGTYQGNVSRYTIPPGPPYYEQ